VINAATDRRHLLDLIIFALIVPALAGVLVISDCQASPKPSPSLSPCDDCPAHVAQLWQRQTIVWRR
jgi:hypothetical protein